MFNFSLTQGFNSICQSSKQQRQFIDDCTTESNSLSQFIQDPMDINKFLNLEDDIFPKMEIQAKYEPKLEDDEYMQDQFQLLNYPNENLYITQIQNNGFPHSFKEKKEAEKIIQKSKRIIKREKAKNRGQVQMVQSIQTSQIQQIQEEYQKLHNMEGNFEMIQQCQIPTDPKQQKKMLQIIRNRISAQNSRDRKKAYINQLEDQQQKLYDEKKALSSRIDELLKEVQQQKQDNDYMRKEQNQFKQFIQMAEPTKVQYKGLSMALFSILTILTFLNLNPNQTQLQENQQFEFASDKMLYNLENFNFNKDLNEVIKQYNDINYLPELEINDSIQIKVKKEDDSMATEELYPEISPMQCQQLHKSFINKNNKNQQFQVNNTMYSDNYYEKVAQMAQQISNNWEKMQIDKQIIQSEFKQKEKQRLQI